MDCTTDIIIITQNKTLMVDLRVQLSILEELDVCYQSMKELLRTYNPCDEGLYKIHHKVSDIA